MMITVIVPQPGMTGTSRVIRLYERWDIMERLAFEKKNTCAFTGHRPERLHFLETEVVSWLECEIRKAISDGYTTFITGMQRGVDIWAAEIVLKIRDEGQNINLVAASAFEGMESSWDESWQTRYRSIIEKADKVVYVSENPGKAAFIQRDHYMVDRASRLLAVYSGGRGGTFETMQYAEKERVEIIKYTCPQEQLTFEGI